MNKEDIIAEMKMRRSKYLTSSTKKLKPTKYLKGLITRSLLSICLLLIGVIMLKSSNSKKMLVDNVFTTNLSFAKISNLYDKYFGSLVPELPSLKTPTETVFKEELVYEAKDDYLNGIKLNVASNYLVPVLKSGIIVFVGDKEGYQNTIIVQGVDGTDIWYGNIANSDYKLYDYVEEGKLLGEAVNNTLYIVLQKDGEYLKFDEYFKKD